MKPASWKYYLNTLNLPSSLRRLSYRWKLLPLAIFSVIILPAQAAPAYSDPFALIRAGQWDKIKNYFRNRNPDERVHKYILAKATLEEDRSDHSSSGSGQFSKDRGEAISLFLSAGNIHCSPGNSEDHFIACIRNLSSDSIHDLLGRLAIYSAAGASEETGGDQLYYRLLSLASLDKMDPLNRSIYTKRLEFLYKSNRMAEAERLARSHDNIHSPFVDVWRGKILLKQGDKNGALKMYLSAANQAGVSWVKRIVYEDLSSQIPEIFQSDRIMNRRELARALIPLISFMENNEKEILGRAVSFSDLVSTASPVTLEEDGLFLIQTEQKRLLSPFAEKSYTHISTHPEILYAWVQELDEKTDRKVYDSLMSKFEQARKGYAPLWRFHLDRMKEYGEKDAYFAEIIAYLQEHRTDIQVMDELIEFLIGKDHKHIHWASHKYWETAARKIFPSTGSGRFIYWLERYYRESGYTTQANRLLQNFYASAPGSYYAQAFWDRMSPGDYRKEWSGVRTKEDYLRWVSIHGNNPDALTFISNVDRRAFLNPDAVNLWNTIQNTSYDIPSEIVLLYRLGELSFGSEFFNEIYEGKISRIETLSRLAYVGRETDNLFISVYYLRTLLRELKIPEDPFTLPSGLLAELYPRPYREHVQRYTSSYGIKEEMVYGLMRQESMFRELAISRSGAMGLMQIMPRTGKWMAKKLKIRNPNFFEPEVSIRIGTKYFSDLMKNYDLDFRWAAIAYNGGPGNLRKWKREYFKGDFNKFLENIPISEPRNYCRITFQNYMHYRVTYMLNPVL